MTPMLRRSAIASAAALLLILPLPAAAGWQPVGPFGGTVNALVPGSGRAPTTACSSSVH